MCNHPVYNSITNKCETCGESITRKARIYPASYRPGMSFRVISDELYELMLHDNRQPRTTRERIINDHNIEDKAMNTVCKDGRTVKEVIDVMVYQENCRNFVRRGGWLYVSNADRQDRYTLRIDYEPYLMVALRNINPLFEIDRQMDDTNQIYF